VLQNYEKEHKKKAQKWSDHFVLFFNQASLMVLAAPKV
jgi:hypothetical protein